MSTTSNDNLIILINVWIDELTYNEDKLLTAEEMELMQCTPKYAITSNDVETFCAKYDQWITSFHV